MNIEHRLCRQRSLDQFPGSPDEVPQLSDAFENQADTPLNALQKHVEQLEKSVEGVQEVIDSIQQLFRMQQVEQMLQAFTELSTLDTSLVAPSALSLNLSQLPDGCTLLQSNSPFRISILRPLGSLQSLLPKRTSNGFVRTLPRITPNAFLVNEGEKRTLLPTTPPQSSDASSEFSTLLDQLRGDEVLREKLIRALAALIEEALKLTSSEESTTPSSVEDTLSSTPKPSNTSAQESSANTDEEVDSTSDATEESDEEHVSPEQKRERRKARLAVNRAKEAADSIRSLLQKPAIMRLRNSHPLKKSLQKLYAQANEHLRDAKLSLREVKDASGAKEAIRHRKQTEQSADNAEDMLQKARKRLRKHRMKDKEPDSDGDSIPDSGDVKEKIGTKAEEIAKAKEAVDTLRNIKTVLQKELTTRPGKAAKIVADRIGATLKILKSRTSPNNKLIAKMAEMQVNIPEQTEDSVHERIEKAITSVDTCITDAETSLQVAQDAGTAAEAADARRQTENMAKEGASIQDKLMTSLNAPFTDYVYDPAISALDLTEEDLKNLKLEDVWKEKQDAEEQVYVLNWLEDLWEARENGGKQRYVLVQADYQGCPGCEAHRRARELENHIIDHGHKDGCKEDLLEFLAQSKQDVDDVFEFEEWLNAEQIGKMEIPMPPVPNAKRPTMTESGIYKLAQRLGIEPWDSRPGKNKPRFPNGIIIDLEAISKTELDAIKAGTGKMPKRAIVSTVKPDDYYKGKNDTKFNTGLSGKIARDIKRFEDRLLV